MQAVPSPCWEALGSCWLNCQPHPCVGQDGWRVTLGSLSLCREKGRAGAAWVPTLALFPPGGKWLPDGLRALWLEETGVTEAIPALLSGWEVMDVLDLAGFPSPAALEGLAGGPPPPSCAGDKAMVLLLLRAGAREATSQESSFTRLQNVWFPA